MNYRARSNSSFNFPECRERSAYVFQELEIKNGFSNNVDKVNWMWPWEIHVVQNEWSRSFTGERVLHRKLGPWFLSNTLTANCWVLYLDLMHICTLKYLFLNDYATLDLLRSDFSSFLSAEDKTVRPEFIYIYSRSSNVAPWPWEWLETCEDAFERSSPSILHKSLALGLLGFLSNILAGMRLKDVLELDHAWASECLKELFSWSFLTFLW